MGELFKKVHYVEEARKAFLRYIHDNMINNEIVPLGKALRRVLAEDIYSKVNVPPFNRAAMDGYAVIAEDTFGASEDNPVELRIIGESAIGKPFKGVLKHGDAVKIHTGAKVPDGANAVVRVEFTEECGDSVLIYSPVAPNDNVGKIGEDVKAGELVLKKGIVIQPFDLALLKSVGFTEVLVKKKPIVGLFSCGDELTDSVEDASVMEGMIVDTNRIMFSSYLRELGCDVLDLGIIPDNINIIEETVKRAMKETDLLITLGGTSVGEKDLLPRVLSSLGEPGILVRGITAMPGRPLTLSVINGFPIISLPGYPVAALIDFIEFVIPTIEKMLGIKGVKMLRKVKAKLKHRISSRPGVRNYVRVRLYVENGEFYADPIRITGSGVLSSVVKSDGLLVIPEDLEGYEAGQVVDVILFRDRVGVWDEKDI